MRSIVALGPIFYPKQVTLRHFRSETTTACREFATLPAHRRSSCYAARALHPFARETAHHHRNFRLFTSVLSSNRSVSYLTGPSSFLSLVCSNAPLLLSRFVGVFSYSPPLCWFFKSSSSVAAGPPELGASSYSLYFRFCAVLGVCIKRRKRLSCSRLLTSSVTSMC